MINPMGEMFTTEGSGKGIWKFLYNSCEVILWIKSTRVLLYKEQEMLIIAYTVITCKAYKIFCLFFPANGV